MSNHVEAEDWLTVEEAADVLRLTTRQVNRYGAGDTPRLHTKRVSRRVLYLRQDVLDLADELNVTLKPKVHQQSKTEMVPAGEMLDYLRERDQRLDDMQRQLTKAALDMGRLEGQLEVQRKITIDMEETQRRLAAAEARAAMVEAENVQLRTQLASTSNHVQMDGQDVEDIPTMSSEPTVAEPEQPRRSWWRRWFT